MSIIWSQIHAFFTNRDKRTTGVIALCLVVLVGYLDFATGFEISLSFLYLVPVAISTWYLGARYGWLMACISILTWILSNQAAGQTYTHEIIRYWNALTRLTVFTIIILLLEEFKRALLHERMLSQTDHLTGIANNREFYQKLNAEIERSSRTKCPFSVAYIDLDGFKQVNDKLGHRQGDLVLRTVAQTFQSSIRKTDFVGRLGGDEFAILLPNTDQLGARFIMARVQNRVQEQMETLATGVTLSAGVISFASVPESVDDLLNQVDRLMYDAKSGGKDMILFIEQG